MKKARIESSLTVLLVSDLARSQDYYKTRLGCEVTEYWAIRDDFGLGFKLVQADSPEDVRPNKGTWNTYAYIRTVGELDDLYEELTAAGALIHSGPEEHTFDWGVWKEFAIRDPDGYVIGFGSGQKEDVPQPAVSTVGSPITKRMGSVFIPVTNIGASRDWYCRLLGLDPDNSRILFDHLCPLEGTSIMLDTMPRWGGDQPGGAPPIVTPAFQLLTRDIEGAFRFVQELGVETVTAVENRHWFVIRDPDGNKLMICQAD